MIKEKDSFKISSCVQTVTPHLLTPSGSSHYILGLASDVLTEIDFKRLKENSKKIVYTRKHLRSDLKKPQMNLGASFLLARLTCFRLDLWDRAKGELMRRGICMGTNSRESPLQNRH